MEKYRRICIYSGPGAGKSTAAAYMFSMFKRDGLSVELVQEHVKELAYAGVKITPYQQLYIFAEQMRREELLLRCGVQIVITDSPIKLGICYASKYECPFCQQMMNIANKFDEQYKPLNIYMRRPADAKYVEEGRYENHKQALEMDKEIKDLLYHEKAGFVEVDAFDHDGIMKCVKEKLRI